MSEKRAANWREQKECFAICQARIIAQVNGFTWRTYLEWFDRCLDCHMQVSEALEATLS